jgi:hypothetical protein
MSRTKPTILLETLEDDVRAYQVCASDAIYAVYYEGAPIKIRTYTNIEVVYPGPKYTKTSFPESGHAFNLCERLNKRFNTTLFTVVSLRHGKTVSEE